MVHDRKPARLGSEHEIAPGRRVGIRRERAAHPRDLRNGQRRRQFAVEVGRVSVPT
jgi:hypothetical protein